MENTSLFKLQEIGLKWKQKALSCLKGKNLYECEELDRGLILDVLEPRELGDGGLGDGWNQKIKGDIEYRDFIKFL